MNKRSWLTYLFIALSVGLLAIGTADAATPGTVSACIDCHGTNPLTAQAPIESATRNTPARAILGSHGPHMNGVLTCTDCHLPVSAATLSHRNGKIDMQASIRGGAYTLGTSITQFNHTVNSGFGTCTNNCHTAVSPAWAASTALTCTSCHANPPATGAHAGHVSSVMTPAIACDTCHTGASAMVPGAMITATHPNGTKNNNCNNATCHNPVAFFTANALGTTSAPSWTGGGNADCGWCHDNPPTTSALYTHTSVSPGVCSGCHGHNGSGAAHMDGSYFLPHWPATAAMVTRRHFRARTTCIRAHR
jgi:hypothetical protein